MILPNLLFCLSVAAVLGFTQQCSAAPTSSSPMEVPNIILPRSTHNSSSELVTDFPIHASCNASQRMQLQRGLFDLKRVNRAAIDHLLRYGNSSETFITYFGEKADPAVPLGIYERILSGDKSQTLLRCDDPDQNCATQIGYNGHWRGSNASEETVICNLSFISRLPLEKICSNGFQLARDNLNVYWGLDLLHRSMHLPSLTNDFVTHVADEYAAALDLAKENAEQTVKNQRTLQYFAFEVFARQHVDPQGCVGQIEHDHDHNDSASTSTASLSSSTATSQPASSTAAAASAAPTAGAQDCHTHADGTVHCS